MKNYILKMFMALTVVLAVGVSTAGFVGTGEVYADSHINEDVREDCREDTKVLDPTCLKKNANTDTILDKLFGFAQIIASIGFGLAVIMISYAGVKYITAQGDPKQTEQAKMQIINALWGIGISLLAFVILSLFESLF